MARFLVLLAALVFVGGFGFLTLATISEQGLSLGTVLSAFILLILAVGIIGAMRDPPR
jgi:hypothetical protein